MFGPYVLLGELGAGGMGVVYRARHLPANRTVALKMIRSEGPASEEVERRLRLEAEAVAALEHPNIVPIYDVGEHEGRFFVSMKLLPGGTLAEALAGGPMTPKRAAQMLARVARAADHAHQRGVLHRDIKPANILLDDAGEPHLADFGLAKVLGSGQGLTVSRSALGTPAYMAPEIALQGARAATIAADVYSLGAVLYQALAGQAPFGGDSPLEVLDKARRDRPVAPGLVRPGIPRDLEGACLKCLEQDPRRRYASAAGLAEDLERFLRGEPVSARPPGALRAALGWVRRHRVAAGFGTALLASLLAGLGATAWQWRRAEAFLLHSLASGRRLEETLVWREQRDVESLMASGRLQNGLQRLALLVREHPADPLPASRLYAALAGRPVLWPTLAPLVHPAPVVQGAFTPDGRQVVTAAGDGKVRVWDVSDGRMLAALAHDSDRGRFALSPEGRLLAVLPPGGAVDVWKVPEMRLAHSELSLETPVASMVFGPHGAWLAAGDSRGRAAVWQMDSGRQTAAWDAGGPFSILLAHPVQESLYTLGQECKLWRAPFPNLPGAAPVFSFRLPDTAAHATLSPDGAWMLVGAGATALFRDAASGARLKEFTYNATVLFTAISRGGSEAVVVNDGPRAHVYALREGEWRGRTLPYAESLATARFDPIGRWLATAGADGKARLWVPDRGVLYVEAFGHDHSLADAVWSRDGRRLLTLSSDGTARLWSTPAPLAEELPLPIPADNTVCDLSPDNRWVAAAGADQRVRLVSASPRDSAVRGLSHPAAVNALSFSPDSRWAAAGDESGEVSICSVPDALPVEARLRHCGPVRALLWSPDSQRLAVSLSNQVQVWHWKEGQNHGGRALPFAQALAFSRDGRQLLMAAGRRSWVMDCATGRRVSEGPEMPGPIACVGFAPDGRHVACASSENALAVWDPATGQLAFPWLRPGGDPLCLAFSPSSEWLLSGGEDGTVRLWDVQRGVLKQNLTQHRRRVGSVGWSPDGVWIVSGSANRDVRLTHAASGLPGADVLEKSGSAKVRFNRDGARILVISEGAPPRLLRTPASVMPASEALVAMAELALGKALDANGGWDELSPEAFEQRLCLVRAAWHGTGPPLLARFFRSRLAFSGAALEKTASGTTNLGTAAP